VENEPALLPVRIDAPARPSAPVERIRTAAPGGTLTIEFRTVGPCIEGRKFCSVRGPYNQAGWPK